LKNTVPASFILSQEIDSESMPLGSGNPNSWDEYLLQVCNARLSSVLEKEKTQFEDIFEPCDKLRPKILSHLETLTKFLSSPSVYPSRYPFPKCIIELRKMISKAISEELY